MLVRDPSPFAPILLGTFAPSTDGLLIGFVVPSGSRPAEKTLDLPVSGTWNWGVLASKSIGPYFAITVRVNKGEPGVVCGLAFGSVRTGNHLYYLSRFVLRS